MDVSFQNMTDLITVSIACADAAEADKIARHLVEHRLAACVQAHPIHSTYIWQGQLESATEILLTAKTLADRFDALAAAVQDLHSYDVPEIIAQPIVQVAASYELWLRQVLTAT